MSNVFFEVEVKKDDIKMENMNSYLKFNFLLAVSNKEICIFLKVDSDIIGSQRFIFLP